MNLLIIRQTQTVSSKEARRILVLLIYWLFSKLLIAKLNNWKEKVFRTVFKKIKSVYLYSSLLFRRYHRSSTLCLFGLWLGWYGNLSKIIVLLWFHPECNLLHEGVPSLNELNVSLDSKIPSSYDIQLLLRTNKVWLLSFSLLKKWTFF